MIEKEMEHRQKKVEASRMGPSEMDEFQGALEADLERVVSSSSVEAVGA